MTEIGVQSFYTPLYQTKLIYKRELYMKLRKIISLITATSIIVLSLASCSKTPESLMEKANKKLTRLDHTVEVNVDYTAKEQGMQTLFEELENVNTTLFFSGDSVSIENNTTMNTVAGEATFFNNCVLIDGKVYASSGYKIATGGNLNKLKQEITDEQKQTLVEKAGMIIGIDIEDFADVTLDKRDGEYYLTCTDASEELNIRLEKLMIAQLQDAVETVSVKNARMVIEIDGGKLDTVTVKCDYGITLYGAVYSVEAEFELEYDYDDYFKVEAPSDANEYHYTEFDKILNIF